METAGAGEQSREAPAVNHRWAARAHTPRAEERRGGTEGEGGEEEGRGGGVGERVGEERGGGQRRRVGAEEENTGQLGLMILEWAAAGPAASGG